MNTTTLRGIFPEPKPVHRRNFMRENIRNLKEMQGFIQEHKITSKSHTNKQPPNKYKNVAPRVYSNISTLRKLSNSDTIKRPFSYPTPQDKKIKLPNRFSFFKSQSSSTDRKSIHKGVQTERPEDIPKLYETGVLKYPSNIPHMSIKQQTPKPPRPRDKGDSPNLEKNSPTEKTLTKKMQSLDLGEKPDFIKQNKKNLKSKAKKEDNVDPLQPPPTYQKGALPKYLQEQKSQDSTTGDNFGYEAENLTGLVKLPDEERKEYLKVARENYAGLIKELNSMPVSNDTLKKRKRKMEIEDELKRLDEVIKIFQKPKVFVKADA